MPERTRSDHVPEGAAIKRVSNPRASLAGDLSHLQRAAGNRAIRNALREANAGSAAPPDARGKPRFAVNTASDSAISRMITKVKAGAGGLLKVTTNGTRPPGPLVGGSQGDHIAPFTTLQHQIVNAIADQTAGDAWASLVATHAVYRNLPGYAVSRKWLTLQSDDIYATNSAADAATKDEADVMTYANDLLTIRNQLELTSVPTAGGSTGGRNESNTAGGLQVLEGSLRRGKATKYTADDVLINMVAMTDTARLSHVASEVKRTSMVTQSAVTMLDAYPTVTEHFALTTADVTNAVDAKMDDGDDSDG